MSSIPHKKYKTIDYIDDILIVKKIVKPDPFSVEASEIGEECSCFESGCNCKINKLIEGQQEFIRKQLQILKAEERGKQALIFEIGTLKRNQEQNTELIRTRQHVRDIENERAKKIASLPPPLPKSIKSLLKKSDEQPKMSKPVEMPPELTVVKIKPVDRKKENKENILDSEELEARQKIEAEWQNKAEKRFNEALRKDRQKQEYSNIMKQIQSAELQNRQKMARNVSSEKKGMPCPLSDKIEVSRKQADMEQATEKLFKKISNKEHAIEDIEGYQDHYEEKYKKIDSNYESRMIDCIPDFVKENYAYLLEEETKFQGGRKFSGLDDSGSDIFNEAYIESPPADELDDGAKIDLAISQFDQFRSNFQMEYEQTLKPLLAAAIGVSEKKLSDKAVETELIKSPAEDKAVETDFCLSTDQSSPSPLPVFDYNKAGLMSYKRRYPGPILSPYQKIIVPDMHQRDVHYTVPSVTDTEELATASWTPSSYCSLPSKHGIPTLTNEGESVQCDICTAEKNDDCVEIPQENPTKSAIFANKSDKLTINKETFSKYVRQLAKKYLIPKPSIQSYEEQNSITKTVNDPAFPVDSEIENGNQAFERVVICKSKPGVYVGEEQKFSGFVPTKEVIQNSITKTVNDSAFPMDSEIENGSQAFEKVVICKSKPGVYVGEEQKFSGFVPTKEVILEKVVSQSLPSSTEKHDATKAKEIIHRDETLIKKLYDASEDRTVQDLKDDIYRKISESPQSPFEYSDYDLETKRIQAIQQVLSRRVPQSVSDFSPKRIEPENLNTENDPGSLLNQNIMGVKPHVYHDLSTIQELDSALTAGSIHLSHSKLSDTLEEKGIPEPSSQGKSKDNVIQSVEGLKLTSLLDPPDSEVSELAKSIHFVEAEDKAATPLDVPETTSSSSKPSSISPHITGSDSSDSSQGKIFSSTLKDHIKHSQKDTRVLPKYFQDISSIQQKDSGSEKSSSSVLLSEFIPNYVSSVSSSTESFPSVIARKSNKEVLDFDKNMKRTIPSKGTVFGHLFNQPHLSESNGSFKPMTPYSNISSPSELHDLTPKSGHVGVATSVESFKALTPYSDISSPSESTSHVIEYGMQGFASSSGSFKALTPQSNISSPDEFSAPERQTNESASHVFEHRMQDFASSSGSFKALTPQSNISSPGEFSAPERTSSNSENINPITTPLCSDSEIEVKRKIFSGISDLQPSFKRLEFSRSSASSKASSEQSELKALSHFGCHRALKAQVPNSSSDMLPTTVLKEKQITTEKEMYSTHEPQQSKKIIEKKSEMKDEFKTNFKTQENKIKDKKSAYQFSSDYFIPDSDSLNESKKDDCDLIENTLTTRSVENLPKSTSDLQLISHTRERLPEKKEIRKHENLLNLEKEKNLKLSSNLQGIFSSSSSDTLSEISESKVVCQSTPVKEFSKLIQEPGILEEPDLTLINTVLSYKVDSPLKPNSSTSTSPFQNPGYVDSPSLMSFLQHEESCFQTENTKGSLSAEDQKLSDTAVCKTSQLNEVKKTLFPRDDFKQRTKRLWNNLEEVRKKKYDDERKKRMIVNQQKAKEFAKKFTPKRKEK